MAMPGHAPACLPGRQVRGRAQAELKERSKKPTEAAVKTFQVILAPPGLPATRKFGASEKQPVKPGRLIVEDKQPGKPGRLTLKLHKLPFNQAIGFQEPEDVGSGLQLTDISFVFGESADLFYLLTHHIINHDGIG